MHALSLGRSVQPGVRRPMSDVALSPDAHAGSATRARWTVAAVEALFELPLSVASLIGFITLAGISVRNGILKISHYINLMAHEGEAFGKPMIVRGSLERLAPVFMTALGAALALIPLMIGGDEPGKEILHPVAVVIFGGLISATLLDTLLTPVLFHRYGERPARRLVEERGRADNY